MAHKRWSTEEVEYLKENWGRRSAYDIGKDLDRTRSSINRKAHTLNLKLSNEEFKKMTGKTRWTKDMEEYLRENYGKIATKDIAEHLGIDSEHKIRKKAQYMGCGGNYHKWTPEEEEYLYENWGEVAVGTIARRIGVTIESVRLKAYCLGLRDPSNWSGDYLSVPVVSDIIGITRKQLYGMIHSKKIKSRKLSVGTAYRYQIHFSDVIKFLKENTDKYHTKNCDLDFIQCMLTEYRLTGETDIKILELPDWWLDKLAMDKMYSDIGKKARKFWTMNEDKRLLKLLDSGQYTVKVISQKTGRTVYSIQGRIRMLKKKGVI